MLELVEFLMKVPEVREVSGGWFDVAVRVDVTVRSLGVAGVVCSTSLGVFHWAKSFIAREINSYFS